MAADHYHNQEKLRFLFPQILDNTLCYQAFYVEYQGVSNIWPWLAEAIIECKVLVTNLEDHSYLPRVLEPGYVSSSIILSLGRAQSLCRQGQACAITRRHCFSSLVIVSIFLPVTFSHQLHGVSVHIQWSLEGHQSTEMFSYSSRSQVFLPWVWVIWCKCTHWEK